MGLTNVAGVFSRYFIVGFFLPAFFALVALVRIVDRAFLPPVYLDATPGGQIAIVGGAALLVGLVLLGLHYPIMRLYEGYPLQAHGSRGPLRLLHGVLLKRQQKQFDRALKRSKASEVTEAERFDRKWRLDLQFPHDDPGLLLPTAFGNAIRAFERHSMTCWHLNSIGAWPGIELLLSQQEAQVLSDARGDVAFFVNGSLLAGVSAIVLAASEISHGGAGAWYLSVLICLAAIAVFGLAYRAAVPAAVRWGSVVRAAIDIHRLEFYTRLGVRVPRDFKDERQIAWRLNAALLVGDRLPDDLAAGVDRSAASDPVPADGDGSAKRDVIVPLDRTVGPQGGTPDG